MKIVVTGTRGIPNVIFQKKYDYLCSENLTIQD